MYSDVPSVEKADLSSALHSGSKGQRHISVCICTFKRPQLLARVLEALRDQETHGQFTYSIVVVDNDRMKSAESIVSSFVAESCHSVTYCVEPRQNIALARNSAIANANGDFVAFIDDDEIPTKSWLLTLLKACDEYQADGVLGPVKPLFDPGVPEWVVKGEFYNRPTYPTGFVIDGRKGRTGNVLLKRRIFSRDVQPFRPEFLTGEDQDFFRRMIDRKFVFVWCNEAPAYEVVPQQRWKRSFMLKRALLRGKTAVVHTTFGPRDVVKSIIAIPIYGIVLPFTLVRGQHEFMTILVKIFDHLGKLFALVGLDPVGNQYITE